MKDEKESVSRKFQLVTRLEGHLKEDFDDFADYVFNLIGHFTQEVETFRATLGEADEAIREVIKAKSLEKAESAAREFCADIDSE